MWTRWGGKWVHFTQFYIVCCFPLVDISIRSRDICNQSPKLSKITPISAPTNFEGAAPRKMCRLNFRPSLMWTSLVRSFRLAPTLVAVIRNFCSPHIFSGAPKFLDLTFKDPHISDHAAKFRSDRRGSLELLHLNVKKLPHKLFSGGCHLFWDLHCLSADTYNHVWKFHGDQLRQFGDIVLRCQN